MLVSNNSKEVAFVWY